jgi:sugar transferase (PEP-CTERM/EpsH1 system associated)
MRDILFLAHRIPYPPSRGDKIRSWHVLKRLGELGRVHLGCFADDAEDAANLPALRDAMGERLGEVHVEIRRTSKLQAGFSALLHKRPASLAMFKSPAIHAFVGRMLAEQDIGTIFAFSGQMAQFVPQLCAPRFVMDFVDVDSAKFADYAGGIGAGSWVMRREAHTLLAYDRATAARADVSLFVSESEAALFRRRTGLRDTDIRVVQNGVDLDYFDPAAEFPRVDPDKWREHRIILFTGQMNYRPNIEAVAWFAREALPLIRRHRPDACFVIAGRDPAPEVRRLEGKGVIVTGEVSDMRCWLAEAAVVVAPLRTARGVQNKVLEAMAMARPVVATPAAFEGIEAVPGDHLIVTGNIADAVLGLLTNSARAAAIGTAARRQVESRYSWAESLAPLAGIVAPEAG